MEKNFRQSVQEQVRNNLIESKFPQEPVTYGQALVTYHYLQNQPIQEAEPRNTLARRTQHQVTQGIQKGHVE